MNLLFFSVVCNAQLGAIWAKRMGGVGWDEANSIARDKNGNVYTSGCFQGTVDFDGGPGVFNLTSIGTTDLFVAKYTTTGNFIWAKQIAKALDFSVAVDTFNNIYISGGFNSTAGIADFDPGPATYAVNPTNGKAFVWKLDSSGNFVWVTQTAAFANAIAVDVNANVYTIGYFTDSVDFDPSIGVYTLHSAGAADFFLSKLNSSGHFKWAARFGGPEEDHAHDLAIDKQGNVITTGDFNNTIDFDPGPGVFNLISPVGTQSGFIHKSDSLGNFLFAKQIESSPGTTGSLWTIYPAGIAVDSSGDIYLTGQFQDTLDFDPGPGVYNLTPLGSAEVFICKLDLSGNLLWAKALGSTYADLGADIKIDRSGYVYITGLAEETIDADPGPGVYDLDCTTFYDGWILKLDGLGNFLCAGKVGGTNWDLVRSMAVDDSSNVYLTGVFQGTSDFDPDTGVLNLSSAGGGDAFICKLSTCCVASTDPTTISSTSLTICSGEAVTLTESGGTLGTLATWNWQTDSCGGSFVGAGVSIVVSPLTSTTYFVRAENECNTTACAAITINVKPTPTASFTSTYSVDCKGVTVEFLNQSTTADHYQWDFGDGSTAEQYNTTHIFNLNSNDLVSLIAMNNNSCSDTIFVQNNFVNYFNITVPNVFTPNNDGINDAFKIDLDANVRECFSITIIDRWGITLFTSTDPAFYWDGMTGSERKASQGTYFYVMEVNGMDYEGYLSLLE